LIREYDPVLLHRDAESNDLTETYFDSGVLKRKDFFDALHLAIASANGIDIFISWNMRHIVKRQTQLLVNVTNRVQGYRELEIWTPEELIGYED
jgi:hypothetical protein